MEHLGPIEFRRNEAILNEKGLNPQLEREQITGIAWMKIESCFVFLEM